MSHLPENPGEGDSPWCEDPDSPGDRDVATETDPITEVVYNWRDITADFSTACRRLKLGELLHDHSFGLFEAMSAIELMDPKMDAGMMCNQPKRKVTSFEQGIKSSMVKVADLSMSELIGIIDDTLACLVTWLEGHTLAQTVFTNLYMHDFAVIEDRPLKAFCTCMLKTVDIVRDRVNRAAVFEEEDFQPMTHGFKMATEVTNIRAMGMLREVEEDVNRVIKSTRSRPGEERDPVKELEHELAVGLCARLRFCRLFLATLVSFSKDKLQNLEESLKLLKQLTDILPTISRTVSLGLASPNEVDGTRDYPTIMGFEPLVNQRLLPPTFPRYTQIRTRQETVQYLLDLVGRLKVICGVVDKNGFHAVMLIYLPNRRIFGTQNSSDVMRDAIRSFIAPPVLMPKSPITNTPQCKEYVDAFLSHSARPMTQLIQITGHNRARQRDKWAHHLDELAFLQEGADRVDAYLHSFLSKLEPGRQHLACFGTWVLYHTLKVMIHYILAGFELELYAVHEYHFIFWYLYECLYSWLISTLTRADSFQLEQEAIAEQQQKGRTNKKNKKKKKTRQHAREVAMAQAAQSLCGGYYKALVGFSMDSKLKMPNVEFDNEEVRYNHRLAPFGCLVTPPPVHYPQFKEMTDLSRYDPPLEPRDLYSGACKCFQQARLYYETISNPDDEIQNLLKIAKTNFIVMKLLVGGHKKDSKAPPEFDFSLHRIFPIIKIP